MKTPNELADDLRFENGLPRNEEAIATLARGLFSKDGRVVIDVEKLIAGDSTHLSLVQTLLGIGGAIIQVEVADRAALLLLTIAQVQNGDYIAVTADTDGEPRTYEVVDQDLLSPDGSTPGSLDAFVRFAAQISDIAGLVTALAGKEPAQTTASQAEAEDGSSTSVRRWTPQRIAQAIAALAPPVGDPNVAHIRTDGDDDTGTGTPSKPFRHPQAAFTAGFRKFDFGAGTFNGWDCGSTPSTLQVRGWGAATIISTAVANAGQALEVHDVGGQSVHFDEISTTAADFSGATAGTMVLRQVWSDDVRLRGGTGSGGPAGHGGSLTVYAGCRLDAINARGGDESTDAVGNGGTILITGHSRIGSIDFSAGGGGGSGGSDGTLTAEAFPIITGPLVPDAMTVRGAIVGGGYTTTTYPS